MLLKDTLNELEKIKEKLINSFDDKNKKIDIYYKNDTGKGYDIIKNNFYLVPIEIKFTYKYTESTDNNIITNRYSDIIHDFYNFISIIPSNIRDEYETELSINRNIYYDKIFLSTILNIKVN